MTRSHSKLSIYDYPKIIDAKNRIKVMGKLIGGKKSEPYKPIETARELAIDELIFENPGMVFTNNYVFFENENLVCKPSLFADGLPVIAKYCKDLGKIHDGDDMLNLAYAAGLATESEKLYMLAFNDEGNYHFDSYTIPSYKTRQVKIGVENFFACLEEMQTIDVNELLETYDDLRISIEMAEEKKNELLEAIIAKCGEQDTVFNDGRKLLNIHKKGSIDYGKLVKERFPDIDCEPYRRKPSSYWTIK